MYKLFKVSRSWYYNWIQKASVVNRIDKELNNLVKNILNNKQELLIRLKKVLKQKYGLIVSRRKFQRTLKYLKMKRRFKVITTTSNHTLPITPNHLNRDFYSSVYVGDITIFQPKRDGYI